MALGSKPFMDMRFLRLANRPLELFCNALIDIYNGPDIQEHSWTPEGGLSSVNKQPIWRGWAAVTPNKDWRARLKTHGGNATATHAYRVQLHKIDENFLLPRELWTEGNRVKFKEGQRVAIRQMVGDTTAEGLKMVIRNAVTDSSMWQKTLLCDVDTGDV